jgi:hypothetical protein
VLAELKIGNGVYSLRLMKGWKEVKAEEDTFQRLLVLASCCLGGVKVIEILYNRQEDAWTLEIIASMTHHKSLCYASDSVDMGDGSFLIVSSSFYNKQLCVWRFTDPGVPRSENGWVDGTGYGYGTSVTRPDDTQMTEYDYDYEEDKPDTLIKEI